MGQRVLAATALLLLLVLSCIRKGKGEQLTATWNATLEEGSPAMERWLSSPDPILLKIFIFNLTNAGEVLEGQKPSFQELGPYVYEEKRTKTDVEEDKENSFISYREQRAYLFNQTLSNGTEEDKVTTLNIPIMTMLEVAKNKVTNPMVSNFVKGTLRENDEDLFRPLSVAQLLFRGREIPLLKKIEELAKSQFGLSGLPKNTFGLFEGKNNSVSELFTIQTGHSDPDFVGEIQAWNGTHSLKDWKDSACNFIQGSDGTIYPPFLPGDNPITAFYPDLCRTLRYHFDRELENEGIRALKFKIRGDLSEAASTDGDENECLCLRPKSDRDEKCLKAGAFPGGRCDSSFLPPELRSRDPTVYSNPHFFGADPDYLAMTKGLEPSEAQHLSFILVDNRTGLVLKSHKRIQHNVRLGPNAVFDKLPSMIFPILWYDEVISLDEGTKNQYLSEVSKSGGLSTSYAGTTTLFPLTLTFGLLSRCL